MKESQIQKERENADCVGCKWTPMALYLGGAGYFHYQRKRIGHWPSLILSSMCLLFAGHYLSKNIINVDNTKASHSSSSKDI